MSQVLEHYLALLGLRPGASLQKVTSQYFFILKRFPEHLSADQLKAKQQLHHAYEVLKRAYTSKGTGRVVRRKRRRTRRKARGGGSRSITVGLGIALLVLLGIFVALNSTNIKVRMVSHDPGDQLRWKDSGEAYGKVMRFESRHSFPTGLPGPAYEIELNGTTDTVWVSERIVDDRMVNSGSD